MHTPITLAQVLTRPAFQHAEVVAGRDGLQRPVRWVHVLEVPEPRSLIHGGELVLTTGAGFAGREEAFLHFVQELAEARASGLCIELGGAVTSIPASVLRFADNAAFPLVVFHQMVRFVDITQDLHSLILSRHHKFLDDLEHLSGQLWKLTIQAQGARQIVQLVHAATHCAVIYDGIGRRALVAPASAAGETLQREWTQLLASLEPLPVEPTSAPVPESFAALRELGRSVLVQPVIVLGVRQGVLALFSDEARWDEHDALLMDRVVGSLALDESRRMAIEERERLYEQNWVEQAIRGEAAVPYGTPGSNAADARYRIVRMGVEDELDPTAAVHLSLLTRRVFTRNGMRPYLSARTTHLVLAIEFNAADAAVLKARISEAFHSLCDALEQAGIVHPLHATVGGEVPLHRIADSYREAAAAWSLRRHWPQRPLLFYEDCGIYRWLLLMAANERARRLAQQDLAAVLAYDRAHHTQLAETLRVYLDCDRSVQQTAERLYIHRQTLYHRLHKLRELISLDLDDPVQRLALHVALYFMDMPGGDPDTVGYP